MSHASYGISGRNIHPFIQILAPLLTLGDDLTATAFSATFLKALVVPVVVPLRRQHIT
jgi:hypothetical protein